MTRAVRMLSALAVALVSTWLIANFWVSTKYPVDAETYRVDMSAAPWIQAAGGGPHSWLRQTFYLPAQPDTATLWVDPDQTFEIHINGYAIHASSPAIQQDGGLDPIRRRMVWAVALQPFLQEGANTLVIEVVNGDQKPAAARAELDIRGAGENQVITTGSPGWVATSDASLVNIPSPSRAAHPPVFSEAAFDAQGWAPAVRASPRIGGGWSLVSPSSMETPMAGHTISANPPTGDVRIQDSFQLPAQPQLGWIRVEGSGRMDLEVNGSVIDENIAGTAVGARPDTHSSVPGLKSERVIHVFDIGPLLHRGTNTIVVHSVSLTRAGVAVDGYMSFRSDPPVSIASESTWQSQSAGNALGPAVDLGPVRATSSTNLLVSRVPRNQLTLPIWLRRNVRLEAWGVLVAVWAAVAVLGRALGAVRTDRSFGLAAAGLLPSAATVFMLNQFHHFSDTPPPFPDVPSMLVLVEAILIGGLVVSTASSVLGPALALIARVVPVDRGLRPTPSLVPWASFRSAMPRVAAPTSAVPGLTAIAMVDAPSEPAAMDARSPRLPRWFQAGIVACGAVVAGCFALTLGYDPLWQDEFYSFTAIEAVQKHGLPRWPSGFLYFKGELYHALMAPIGLLTGNSFVWLRGMSLILFVATVAAFGLLLMPLVLPSRHWINLATTAVFALAGPELTWLNQLRYYQMAQMFAVLYIYYLIKAARDGRKRDIVISAVMLVSMYLSHEESFVILFAIPFVMFVWAGLRPLTNRWWLVSYGVAGAVILAQLAASKITHPPTFGVDRSNGSYIGFYPDPWYYMNNLFFGLGGRGTDSGGRSAGYLNPAWGASATLTVISLLGLAAIAVGIRRRDRMRLSFGMLWVIPVAALSVILHDKFARYAFYELPALFALAGMAMGDMTDLGRRLVAPRGRSQEDHASSAGRGLLFVAGIPFLAGVVLSTSVGWFTWGPAVGHALHSPVAQDNPDFAYVDTYLYAHWQPGDVVVVAAPVDEVVIPSGRIPDYWLPYRPGGKLLFIFESHDQAVDVEHGLPSLLDGADLQRVVETHRRVWLVTSDAAYRYTLSDDEQTVISQDFTEVCEGVTSSLYLSGSL